MEGGTDIYIGTDWCDCAVGNEVRGIGPRVVPLRVGDYSARWGVAAVEHWGGVAIGLDPVRMGRPRRESVVGLGEQWVEPAPSASRQDDRSTG